MTQLFLQLLLVALQYVLLKAQDTCTYQLTFLDDYCGHIRRKVIATINQETQDLVLAQTGETVPIGTQLEVTNQITGLYDVCMARRNSYVSDYDNFNYTEWSWQINSCDIIGGKSVATIAVYDSLDCSGNLLLKTWVYEDGTTRNFTDIPPAEEKDEEYWFWWFEDSPDFPGYGNDTWEEISVSCFDGQDDDGIDLNSCEGDYLKAYRFNWPNDLEANYSGFENFTDVEIWDLFTQLDERNNSQIYKAKDIETQYKVIDECLLTYSDYNYNEQWCEIEGGTEYVYQRKWSIDTQGCIDEPDSNSTRFTNGEVKTKDCGFIESGDYKDNDNYNCLVRTICPYFGDYSPSNRTLTTSCPSFSTMFNATDDPKGSASTMSLLAATFIVVIAMAFENL